MVFLTSSFHQEFLMARKVRDLVRLTCRRGKQRYMWRDQKQGHVVSREIKGRKIGELFRVPAKPRSGKSPRRKEELATGRRKMRERRRGEVVHPLFPRYFLFRLSSLHSRITLPLPPSAHKYVNTTMDDSPRRQGYVAHVVE